MKKIMFIKISKKVKQLRFGMALLTVLAALPLTPPDTWASDLVIPIEIPQPHFFGLGVGAYSDYFGSDDAAIGIAPIGRLSIDGERYVSLSANDLRVNLIDSPNWRFGPEFLWRFGRQDVEDEVVKKMHEVDDSQEIGLFGGYTWKDPQELRKQAGFTIWGLWDASSVHDGWTGGANVFGMYPVARPVTLAAGTGFTYGGDDYTDTFFGVTPADSTESGLAAYSASGGIRDARVWITAILHLSEKWHAAAGVMYSRLLGDAADSPVVSERGSEDQWVYGLGVIYAW